jgi:xanthine dehydrogenase YagR molybdenum-binding subunit
MARSGKAQDPRATNNRLDGPEKSSGRAKYPSDLNPQGLLFGILLTSPHAHARIRSIDTSAAEKMKGVTAVRVISRAGTEIQWAGTEVAAVAATSEPLARDAARAIKVDYEVMPHVVQEHDLSKVGARAKPAGEQIRAIRRPAFKDAEVTSQGSYGIPVITHCCLEPHGTVIQWQGDQVKYWPSSQGISTVGAELGRALEVPAANVRVQMEYMGGGFGSKFPADRWHIEAAHLSKASGGRPVKLFLDRAEELTIAGVRPSHFANIKSAQRKTAPSLPGSRTPGRAADSQAAACLRYRT